MLMSKLSGKIREEKHMFMLEKSDPIIMKTSQGTHMALDHELLLLFSAPCVQQDFPSPAPLQQECCHCVALSH